MGNIINITRLLNRKKYIGVISLKKPIPNKFPKNEKKNLVTEYWIIIE